METPARAWLGVVSAEHAAIGAREGWIQLNHGKRTNLNRLHRGDGFVFYSPRQRITDKKAELKSVTQLGIVADDEPYQAEQMVSMGPAGTIRPWRRNVDFASVRPVAVAGLDLELTADANWGYRLRLGLVPLSPADFDLLRKAMLSDG